MATDAHCWELFTLRAMCVLDLEEYHTLMYCPVSSILGGTYRIVVHSAIQMVSNAINRMDGHGALRPRYCLLSKPPRNKAEDKTLCVLPLCSIQ